MKVLFCALLWGRVEEHRCAGFDFLCTPDLSPCSSVADHYDAQIIKCPSTTTGRSVPNTAAYLSLCSIRARLVCSMLHGCRGSLERLVWDSHGSVSEWYLVG